MVLAENKAKSLLLVNHTTKTIHHHHHHHHHNHHQIYPNASIYTNKNKDTVQEIFFLEENLSQKQKEKQILKIHKQFGHSSSPSVKKIINNAGALHSELSKLLTMLNQNKIIELSIENHHPIQLLVMQKRPLLMKLDFYGFTWSLHNLVMQ